MKKIIFFLIALPLLAQAEPDFRYPIPDSVPFNTATRYGNDTTAGSQGGTAIGDSATTNAAEGTAVGYKAQAKPDWATAVGSRSHADGDGATAIGQGSYAKTRSTAVGFAAEANAKDSTAIGAHSVADREDSVSFGNGKEKRQLTNLADGTEDSDAATVRQVRQQAKIKTVELVKESKSYTDTKASQAVSASKAYTDTRFNQLSGYVEDRFNQTDAMIDRLDRKISAGIAGVTAIASIPYVTGSTFSYGLGVGGYRSGSALAAGIQIKATQNTNIRLTASWDSSSNSAIGAGIAGGF